MQIRFNNLIDVVNFSRFTEKNLINSDVNIVCGNICIDAKSILGVSNLDVTKIYDVQIISENKEEIKLFEDYIKPMTVKNK